MWHTDSRLDSTNKVTVPDHKIPGGKMHCNNRVDSCIHLIADWRKHNDKVDGYFLGDLFCVPWPKCSYILALDMANG